MVALAGIFKLLSDQLLFVAPVCVDFMVAYVVEYTSQTDTPTVIPNITSNGSVEFQVKY